MLQVYMIHSYVPCESYVTWYYSIKLDDSLTFMEEPVAILDKNMWVVFERHFCRKGVVDTSSNR